MAEINEPFVKRATGSRVMEISRRDAILLGVAGMAGAAALPQELGRENFPIRTLSNRGASAPSVIFLWLQGGPSQFETFDPKPSAQPSIRSPFGDISTSAPGIVISELMPRTAAIMKYVTLLRTVSHGEGGHERASHLLLTGRTASNSVLSPSLGSIVASNAISSASIPPYVSLSDDTPISGYLNAGLLGDVYDPFVVSVDPNRMPLRFEDLKIPTGYSANRNGPWAAYSDSGSPRESPVWKDRIAFDPESPIMRDRLMDMARTLWDGSSINLDRETVQTREMYGRNMLGQRCLLARRLVENGVKFVVITHDGWDMHAKLKESCPETVSEFDQAYAALVADLHRSGLLRSTLVVCMGEFGRSPEINYQGGRGHWPNNGCAALAGAGLPGGMALGATDPSGIEPIDYIISPQDVASVILNHSQSSMGDASTSYALNSGVSLCGHTAPAARLAHSRGVI